MWMKDPNTKKETWAKMDRIMSGGYYGHAGYHLYSVLDLQNLKLLWTLKALQVQVEGTSTNFPRCWSRCRQKCPGVETSIRAAGL